MTKKEKVVSIHWKKPSVEEHTTISEILNTKKVHLRIGEIIFSFTPVLSFSFVLLNML